jgi:DNA-binding transcriptional regulator GbsR (MarR family)
MKKLLLTTAILAAIGFQQPALAHGDEKHEGQHTEAPAAAPKAVATATDAQGALTEIQAGMKTISTQISENKHDAMHDEIEKIEASIKALKEKSALEGDKKTRLEASLKQLSTQLGKVHSAADAKDAEKTKIEFKKAEGALKLVESAAK